MKPRRDRALLVVIGTSLVSATVVVAGPGCSSDETTTINGDDSAVDTLGYTGNTMSPNTTYFSDSGVDSSAETNDAAVTHISGGQPVHVDVLLTPGEHVLKSSVEYRGNAAGYMGDRFVTRSSRSLDAAKSS